MIKTEYRIRFCHKNQEEICWFHFHNEIEFLIPITEGGNLQIEDSIYPIKPGRMFVISAQTMHHLSAENTPYERYILRINPSVISELSTASINFLECFNSKPHVVDIHAQQEIFLQHMRELCKVEEDRSFGNDIRKTVELLLFLLDAAKQMEYAPEISRMSIDVNVSRVLKIQDYIWNHSQQNLTLEEIANQFFRSKYHLSHIFKKTLHYTVIEYLNYCRVSKACQLLKEQTDTVRVGEQVGFRSNEQFVRCFKHFSGMTPRQYSIKYGEAGQRTKAASNRNPHTVKMKKGKRAYKGKNITPSYSQRHLYNDEDSNI